MIWKDKIEHVSVMCYIVGDREVHIHPTKCTYHILTSRATNTMYFTLLKVNISVLTFGELSVFEEMKLGT